MLRTVHLHGRLGEKFGKTHQLDVQSPAEAVRALIYQFPKFDGYVRHRKYVVTAGRSPDRTACPALTQEQLQIQLGKSRDIHIIPAPLMAGIETIIIVGLTLAVVALSVAAIFMMKAPKPQDREEASKRSSFAFDGPENSIEQGHCIPLVYGEVRAGSVVASAGITTADITADPTDLPGGKWSPPTGGGGGGGGTGGGDGYVGGTPGTDHTVVMEPADRLQYGDIALEGGGGGKGGGGGDGMQEAPNSLQSNATARILEIVSEGECVGLVDGLKSVYLDGTPLQNADGSYNFQGATVQQRVGLPDQDYMPGFAQAENTIAVDTEVSVLLGPVTRTILNPDASVARVTIRVPSLYKQETDDGDINPTTVELKISLQVDGGGFTDVYQMRISGKTNQGYERSVDIHMPPGAARDIRVTRLTPDSEVASLVNETHWSMLSEVVEAKLSYPDTALVGLTVDARQFGTNIPTRGYQWRGLIVEVPTNYDPITRVYTGVWDGTWKRAWTDNPAWCLRDLIVHRRYGLGARIPVENVDKWVLYAIAQYCDELVPDGFGGTEPRYTLNIQIKNKMGAYELIAAMATNFRGWVYWGSGTIVAAMDRPEDPSVLVTRSNTVDGAINYGRITPHEKRRSVAVVYWNDPEDNYRLTPEVVEDPDLIRRLGRRPGDEITAFGVSRKGHAHRLARFILEDESPGSNVAANYEVGDDHSFVAPGHIAMVADPMFTQSRRGGRLRAATANYAVLDQPYPFVPGQNYSLRTMLPDGTVSTRAVQPGGAVSIDFGTWDDNGAAVTADGSFQRLTDDGAGTYEFRNINAASAVNMPHTAIWRVKKDATPKQTRYPIFRTISAAPRYKDVELDTSTGEFGVFFPVGGTDGLPAGVIDGGDHWIVWQHALGTGAGLSVQVYPAVGATAAAFPSGAYNPGTTGEVSVRTPQLVSAYLTEAEIAGLVPLGGAAWGTPPNPGSVWTIETDLVANRQFRVRVVETDRPPYRVRAVAHDPTKYERVELDRDLETPNFIEAPSGPLGAPSEIGVFEYLTAEGTASVPAALFAWTPPADPRVLYFQAQAKRPVGDWFPLGDSLEPSRTIKPVEPGEWRFRVRSVDAFGRVTAWQEGTATLDGQTDSIPEVVAPGITIDSDLLSAALIWDAPADTRPLRYEILYSAGGPIGTAVSLGITDQLTWPITMQGNYWVRPTFLGFTSPAPTLVNASALIFSAGIVAHLTNETVALPALADGTVTSYAGASGEFKIYSGSTDISSAFTLSTPAGGDPQGLTEAYVDRAYSVTAGLDAAEASATLRIRATGSGDWAGVVLDKDFSLTKALQGVTGLFRDIKFKRSPGQPATPVDANPADWSDGIPTGTDTVWSSSALKRGDGTLASAWTTPARLSPLTNRGPYSSTATYYRDDLVQYLGSTYIATANNFTGQAPSGTGEPNAYWDAFAVEGSPGEPGTPPSAFSATIDVPSGTGSNLRTLANAAGYTGLSDATITFEVENAVTANGLLMGSWPFGDYTITLALVVKSGGKVYGLAGAGGAGGAGLPGGHGGSGGDAFSATGPISIDCQTGGEIKGGGGGGGGGGGTAKLVGFPGEEELVIGTGGNGGSGFPSQTGGSAGELNTGAGGGGGAAAAGGANGGNASAGGGATNYSGGSGGAGGYAIRKNGHTVPVSGGGTITGTVG